MGTRFIFVAAVALCAPLLASSAEAASGIRRHHGLGEGVYCHARGVRRYHGLGDGSCRRPRLRFGYGCRYGYTAGPTVNVVGPTTVIRIYQTPAAVSAPGEPTAWSLLRRGETRRAVREFAVLALRSMDDARPKIGFALAAADLGRDGSAVKALRRALELDRSALRAAVADHELDGVVGRILASGPSAPLRDLLEQRDPPDTSAPHSVERLVTVSR